MTLSYISVSYTGSSYTIEGLSPVLVSTDLKIRLSGGAANSDFNASLGGAKSSVEVVNNFNNNVFDDVSSGEHTSGDVEYRCVYLHNSNSTTAMNNVKIYVYSNTSASEDEWDIGLGTSGINGTEQTIVNESTSPLDVTFVHPVSELDGLYISSIPVGQHMAIWFRRTVLAGASTVSDVNISIKYVFDER